MGSSDKRRGGSGSSTTSHANNNALRSSASTSRSSNSSSVIAPPPRAQLGSRPSSPPPGTDNDGGKPNHNSGSRGGSGGIDSDRISIASTISKENNATIAAREKEAAAAQQLREKDDRIAELQWELVQLEAEFARQVELLSQNESETAAFWQAKHSGLNQQFLRTDTELRLLRAEVDVRDAEREELKEGWDVLKRELRERDDEVRRLQALNRGLKEQVSTSTRAYHEQTSDDQFGDDMARLGNGLQNWIIVHFRKAKIGKERPHLGGLLF